jgi:peptidoglycan/LPS O-acetylase OafA/YrhL
VAQQICHLDRSGSVVERSAVSLCFSHTLVSPGCLPFFFTLQAILLPLLVLSTVLHSNTVQGRILESKPLRWIGWISYSLYLWQQLFFGVNFVGSPPGLALLRKPPINLIALLVCATFSHYVIEKPFIAWAISSPQPRFLATALARLRCTHIHFR